MVSKVPLGELERARYVIVERSVCARRWPLSLHHFLRLPEIVVHQHRTPLEQNSHPDDRRREAVQRRIARIESDGFPKSREGLRVVEIVKKPQTPGSKLPHMRIG